MIGVGNVFGIFLIVGGLLRILASFPIELQIISKENFYFIIDSFLFLGIIGLYLRFEINFKSFKFVTFIVSLASSLLLLSRGFIFYKTNPYFIGASFLLLGLTTFSWIVRTTSPETKISFYSFFGSMLFGILASILPVQSFLFSISGILFGLGAIFLGRSRIRKIILE
ncbi:hypothetical protein [Leptospira sarikeiensis]|uniref:Uncharacterized protein n=1 Tax=Leptospira sarikeiensis TaxID=2484943 RepID=A0A4R9KEN0_9LEPT|nr:hypothetical protein [Leptospira sarikeiensis]TGL65712.1 hypothetical protein EHQ64_00665 [Leptospira sarikeiensis]